MEDPHKKQSGKLAILISGAPAYEQGKLLGVPEIVDSNRLSFDTTASNSGWQNGACKKIEILLEKKLFCFACRHYILERLQSAAWQVLFGCTHSPNNEYFKEFQEKWNSILDKDDFKCLDVKVRNMKLQQDSAISIFKEQLKNKNFLLRDITKNTQNLC